jgi:hypothetical protein
LKEGGFSFKETSVFPGSYGESSAAKMAIRKMIMTMINPPTANWFFLKYRQNFDLISISGITEFLLSKGNLRLQIQYSRL